MISAELISDPEFNSLSLESQNIFIRMLSISDDCGVVPANSYRLNVLINTPKKLHDRIEQILNEFVESGLGYLFDYHGQRFFAFKSSSFEDYQSYILKKATKSEYLRIPKKEFQELSKSFPKFLRDSSHIDKSAVNTVESIKQKAESVEVQVVSSKGEVVQVATESEFEKLWRMYPNRQGRKEALRHFSASVKTESDLKNIEKALRNYLGSGNVQRGYILNGKTFFNNWQDWIEPTETMMKGNTGGTADDGKAGFNRVGGLKAEKGKYANSPKVFIAKE